MSASSLIHLWSHVPSQATTKNSSSPSNLCVMISGSTVTICFSALKAWFCLNSKSPIARDNAKLPLTRPNSTNPPALCILAVSSERSVSVSNQRDPVNLPLLVGLWSYDMAFSFPAWPRTARESPELAQISRPSDVARVTTAVHPEGSLKKLGSFH